MSSLVVGRLDLIRKDLVKKEDKDRPHFNFQWAINALLYDAKRDIDH